MSDKRPSLFARGEEFLQLFSRGAEFTKELMRENERLRRELVSVRQEQESAAESPEEWEKLRRELLHRIRDLELEKQNFEERLKLVEEENHQFAERYVEIEEENNNLANLYVASYQLHSTLDVGEVLKIITEIVINLIGAEVFAVYMLDENSDRLGVVVAEGAEPESLPSFHLRSGEVGEAVLGGEPVCWEEALAGDGSHPIVCIPLTVQDRPVGAVVLFKLLQQKDGFTSLDHELFTVLGGHAATALFAARLYSQSARKLNTIQGFIDLLTN